MFKKIFLLLIVTLSFASSALAFSLPTNTEECSSSVETVDVSMLNDSENLSYKLLETSTAILRLSDSIVNSGTSTNTDYVEAMLQLSTDIGTMADRIGEMADRIVATEEEIGYMADRIVATQELQNKNVALTQTNILAAQINLLSALGK